MIIQLSSGPAITIRREALKRIGLRIRQDELKEFGTNDKIVLNNTDQFSGRVLNETITISTNYADIPVEIGKIVKIEFFGRGRVITKITLRNGDTMQGLLKDEDIEIELRLGATIKIYRDKFETITSRTTNM